MVQGSADEMVKALHQRLAKLGADVVEAKGDKDAQSQSLRRVVEGRFAQLEEQVTKEIKARSTQLEEANARLDTALATHQALADVSATIAVDVAKTAKGVVPELARDAHGLIERHQKRKLQTLGAQSEPPSLVTPRIGSPRAAGQPLALQLQSVAAPSELDGNAELLRLSNVLQTTSSQLQALRAQREQDSAKLLEELYHDVTELKGVLDGMRQHREKASARDIDPVWAAIDQLRIGLGTERHQRDLKLGTSADRLHDALATVQEQQFEASTALGAVQDKRLAAVEERIWELEKQLTCESNERQAQATELRDNLQALAHERRETEEGLTAATARLQQRLQQALDRDRDRH